MKIISLLVVAVFLVWIIDGGQNTINLENSVESVTTTQKSKELSVTSARDFILVRTAVTSLPEQTISNEEQAGLIFMREEEKLASDVYSVLYDK